MRNWETLPVCPAKKAIAQRCVGCRYEPSETAQDFLWDVSGKEQMREREGSRQFAEEPAWENKGEKGTKGNAWICVWLCSVPDRCSISCLLIETSLSVFLVRVSARWAGVWMEAGVLVTEGHCGAQQPERLGCRWVQQRV